MKSNTKGSGKLRIGDDWNAIRIIALSQSNPLNAIAEFVDRSIDAHAKVITITRGNERNAHYLAIKADGDGVPRDAGGLPDFKYVATHICDSIKRRLKAEGNGAGLQGEFGIGLLSCKAPVLEAGRRCNALNHSVSRLQKVINIASPFTELATRWRRFPGFAYRRCVWRLWP